ncbi:hypothetical protein PIB30_108550, partial [Stylosanthes scabra]|nr:hypothetical protein [Stylosanthes scabra]
MKVLFWYRISSIYIPRVRSSSGIGLALWMRDKKERKDKGKLDETGKKKSVKASGVKTNVSHMDWNHSTNLSELKGQPLKFHEDHSHNKGVDAYLVKDTSKW